MDTTRGPSNRHGIIPFVGRSHCCRIGSSPTCSARLLAIIYPIKRVVAQVLFSRTQYVRRNDSQLHLVPSANCKKICRKRLVASDPRPYWPEVYGAHFVLVSISQTKKTSASSSRRCHPNPLHSKSIFPFHGSLVSLSHLVFASSSPPFLPSTGTFRKVPAPTVFVSSTARFASYRYDEDIANAEPYLRWPRRPPQFELADASSISSGCSLRAKTTKDSEGRSNLFRRQQNRR